MRTREQIIEQLEYLRKVDDVEYFEWCEILNMDPIIYGKWVFNIEKPNDYDLIVELNRFLEENLYEHDKVNGYMLNPLTEKREYLSFENREDFCAMALYDYPGSAIVEIQ